MDIQETGIPGAVLLTRRIYRDHRGLWTELFDRDAHGIAGIAADYRQDVISISARGVLRGLHFQNPCPQTKLITVVTGAIYDVCLDVRRDSPTFGKWFGATLSETNASQLRIPAGCAHGFLGLEDRNVAMYKLAGQWLPGAEYTIKWDDPALGIEWPIASELIISEKDARGVSLSELVARGVLPSLEDVA